MEGDGIQKIKCYSISRKPQTIQFFNFFEYFFYRFFEVLEEGELGGEGEGGGVSKKIIFDLGVILHNFLLTIEQFFSSQYFYPHLRQ